MNFAKWVRLNHKAIWREYVEELLEKMEGEE